MSLKVFVLALLVCATTVIPGRAQNPFNPGSQPAVVNNGEDSASGTFFRTLFSGSVERIHHWQRLLRERITAYARQIEKSPTGSATLHFLAFTFVFGVLHALGPGHGKAIVCSYFLARRGTLLQALAFSNFITFMHVLSATVLVFSLALLGRRTDIFAFQQLEGSFQTFSAVLILVIGALLLVRALHDAVSAKTPLDSKETAPKGHRSLTALSLSAGLIPCPGAALILLFSLRLQILWLGLLAMPVLAAGMGLTNTLIGLTALGSRRTLLNWTQVSPVLYRRTYAVLALCGSLLILFLGASLLLSGRG